MLVQRASPQEDPVSLRTTDGSGRYSFEVFINTGESTGIQINDWLQNAAQC